MCSEKLQDGWDLTPVIDLINSLSPSVEHTSHADLELRDELNSPSIPNLPAEDHDSYGGLGNFDKLWRYLGQPLAKDPSYLESLEKIDSIEALTKKSNTELINKSVKWRDEIAGADIAENDIIESPTNLRKSRGNKHRSNVERKKSPKGRADVKGLPSGSENDAEPDLQKSSRSQDRKAIIQDILHGTAPKVEKPKSSVSMILKRPQSLSDQEVGSIAKPQFLSGTLAALFLPEQTAYATETEKKARLMNKLSTKFEEDRRFSSATKALACDSNSDSISESGIHVFVDASNILIGFHYALTMSRGLSSKKSARRQPLSFSSLSLVLERGRPTAKRVLVGSDNFPAIIEAKAIGYETNILERVHKARELTPRRKKYSSTSGKNRQIGQSSGSETTVGIYAPEKWVEQAVDEILHLKILESIVDAKVPSTIVLATGDAAEAEYSQGFLKMVERALEKGWMVELVSFRHNTSQAYRRKDFRNKWGKKFRTIELDEFVEELLGA